MKIRSLLFLFLLLTAKVFAQDKGSVKGFVKTSDGMAARQVTISIIGTNKGTHTNDNGEYAINNVPAGTYTLTASSIGLETRQQTIEVKKGEVTNVPEIRLTESAQQLSDIVVTDSRINVFDIKQSEYVSKMPLKNFENPQVYTTISSDLLQQQLVFSVDDAVKNASGVQKMWEATGRGGDGGAYYNARGFILQSQLRNGVAGNVTSRVDAANLERIEVIKGPSATLFGSTLTSYGGLINRVTKKPFDHFGGEVSFSTGSFGFNRVSADVNTPLDREKNFLFRLNTAYQNEGSFQDNGFAKSFMLAPSLYYQVNDRLSFSFDAELYSGENSSKQMIFFYFPASALGASRADELGIDYNRSYSSNDISQLSRSNNFFGQINYKLSNTWTSQTNLTRTYSFSDGPYAYFYLIPNSLVTGDPNATGSDYLARADQSTANSEMHVTEFQQNFIGEFNIGNLRNRFVGGIDIFTQNSNQWFYGANFDTIPKNGYIPNYSNFNRDKLDSVLINGKSWTYPYEFKNSTYSAYLSDVVNITEKIMALAAIRIDYFDNKGSFNEASGKYMGGYTQTTLSPKFGLVYQPILDKVSIFANYQNGFTNKNGVDYAGNTFTPEQANQAEGGVKLNLLDGRITTTLSYYNIQVKDIVRSFTGENPNPSNPNPQIQDGTQISEGVEVDVIANPVEGLNVVAGFAYNNSELEKADADVQGRRPATAMSPYTANVWVSYKFTKGSLQGLGAGVGGNYASDNKILNSVYYGEFTLPAYTVLSATLFYDHARFRAAVKADNLSDERYWIGYTTMNPQKPRSFTASVAIKF
jgi:iron complex outermembrane recepter protein